MDFKNLTNNLLDIERGAQGDFIEVCYNGCCCGNAEKGNAPVLKEMYERRYAALGLAGKIDLRFLACLGFCRDSNTAHAHLTGKPARPEGGDFYFRRMNEEADIIELFRFAQSGVMGERLARKQINVAQETY